MLLLLLLLLVLGPVAFDSGSEIMTLVYTRGFLVSVSGLFFASGGVPLEEVALGLEFGDDWLTSGELVGEGTDAKETNTSESIKSLRSVSVNVREERKTERQEWKKWKEERKRREEKTKWFARCTWIAWGMTNPEKIAWNIGRVRWRCCWRLGCLCDEGSIQWWSANGWSWRRTGREGVACLIGLVVIILKRTWNCCRTRILFNVFRTNTFTIDHLSNTRLSECFDHFLCLKQHRNKMFTLTCPHHSLHTGWSDILRSSFDFVIQHNTERKRSVLVPHCQLQSCNDGKMSTWIDFSVLDLWQYYSSSIQFIG